MIQYADGCLVFASNKDESIPKKFLESNIHNLANYLREHQLNLNSSKTEFICLSKQKDQRNKIQDTILLDNKVIKKSDECKYLGLTIDSCLSFMNYVKQTLKKMAQEEKIENNRLDWISSPNINLWEFISFNCLVTSQLFRLIYSAHSKIYDDFSRKTAELGS